MTLPRRFPGCTFYFEPADITGQILNAGLPAPINVQVVGVNREANLIAAKKLRREIAKIPGAVDVRGSTGADLPGAVAALPIAWAAAQAALLLLLARRRGL